MKIDGQKTEHVEKTDDAKRKDSPAKDDDKKDFKELLERKKGKKGDKDGKTAKKSPEKTAKQTSEKPAQSSLGATRKPGQASTFGERLKDGKLQLGQQTEQRERLGTERNVERHQSETRTEHRHRKKHHRQVQRDHTKNRPDQPAGRPGGAEKSPMRGAAAIAGKPASISSENVESGSPSAPIVGAEAAGASKAEGAASSQVDQKRAQVAELARKLVERAHVGHDASGRQIMLLDLEVPGRGNVRVRLRRRGEGFELRMRPENDELARDLRHEREHFRQSAAEGGVDFTSIEIV